MKALTPVLMFALLFFGCDSASETSENGLSGYWSFNDEFTVDNSGNGNDAISHGAELETGVIGMSANLKGSGYLEIPDEGDFESYERSFSVWVYKSTASINAGFEAIAWKGPDVGPDVAFSLALENTQPPFKVTLSAGDGVAELTSVESDSLIQPGQWYHLLGVVSPVEIVLFVNGEEAGRVENKGGIARNGDPILLGRVSQGSSAARYFNGRVDEVRYYDRALGRSEARLLYQDGK